MEKISTENLYLCILKQIMKREYHSPTIHTTYFNPEERYILARKNKILEEYTDIFTNTTYLYGTDYDLKEGEWGVRTEIPCITNAQYITEEEALEILTTKNTNFMVINREIPKKKRRIRRFGKND